MSCRNVRWKDSVVGYELHACFNTYKLREALLDGTYKISPYQRFMIHEPKDREIVATRIKDRQFQRALCEAGLYEDVTEHFIHDNCACQKGKGVDFAMKRLKTHMRRFYLKHGVNGYVLKMDIHHYFPSTRHDVAKEAMAKRISDPDALRMVCMIIDSFGGNTGIGLGSQVSQLIELAVLDDLDHFIKEQLRIKYYVRYMDDLILIHEDKEYLKHCWNRISEELEKIHLELNRKTSIQPLAQGIKFLQWKFRYTDTGKVLVKMGRPKLKRERRKLAKLLEQEADGIIGYGTSQRSLTAWEANAERGYTYWQVKRMRGFYLARKEQLYDNRRTAAQNRA